MALSRLQRESRDALTVQVWGENPIFRQVLGICSALAVTNLMFNTLLMCGGLIWATSMSALTISLMRNWIPKRVRIMVSVLIIAVYVIVVEIVMKAVFTETYNNIAAYVGLIITNCIVLGRLETYASKNPPLQSFADGLGAGLGYSFILLGVALIREPLGFGSVMGFDLFSSFMQRHNAQWVIMIMPPGAFFVLAIMVWIGRAIDLKWRRTQAAPKAGGTK